eukprot:258691_1
MYVKIHKQLISISNRSNVHLYQMRSYSHHKNMNDIKYNKVMFASIAMSSIAYGFYFFGYNQNQNLLNPQWHLFNTLVPTAIYFNKYINNNKEINEYIGSNMHVITNSLNAKATSQKTNQRTKHGSHILTLNFSFDISGENNKIATVSVYDEYAKNGHDDYRKIGIQVIDKESREILYVFES